MGSQVEIPDNEVEIISQSKQQDIPDSEVQVIPDSEVKIGSGNFLEDAINNTKDILGKAALRTFRSGPTSFNSVTGGPQTEFAHNVKSVALEKFLSPKVGDVLGSIMAESASTATDPQAILAAMQTAKGFQNLYKFGFFEEPTSEQASKAVKKLTTETLQPSKTYLQSYIDQNKPIPAVEEASKIIPKSKTYTDIRSQIDQTIKNTFEKRNQLIAENNAPVDGSYLQRLEIEIKKAREMGQFKPEEIKQMQDVYDREAQFLKENPGFDRVAAQARKETLQDMTKSLLEKQANGETTITEPARKQALDLLRGGLKNAVESAHPEISKLNSVYGGLLDARDMVAGQEALAMKAETPGALRSIGEKIPLVKKMLTRPTSVPMWVAKEAVNRGSNLENLTQRISRLREFIKD